MKFVMIVYVLFLSGCATGGYSNGRSIDYAPMQNFANFLNDSPGSQASSQNCNTVPVRDIYSGEITQYRTVCQ